METASNVGLRAQQPNQVQIQNNNSHIKTAFLVIGIILIVGGAVGAAVLHSRLGHLSLCCLGTFPIGVLFLVLGSRGVQKLDDEDEESEAPIFKELSKIPFSKPDGIDIGIYNIERVKEDDGDKTAIVFGKVTPGKRFGLLKGSKIILFYARHDEDFEDTWSFSDPDEEYHSFNPLGIILKLQSSTQCYILTVKEEEQELHFRVDFSQELTDEFGQKYIRAQFIESN